MKKEITLRNRNVVYLLRKSNRARRVRIAVYCDGSIIVTAPSSLRESAAERFVREKTDWLLSKIDFFRQFKGETFTRYGRADYLKHRRAAYELALRRVEYFNQAYKFRYNAINVKNQKTRWGSCSKRGNLNFNYKIIHLPPRLADYVIVHEVCHLGEFNHSKKFWRLVAKTFPDYREIRVRLNAFSLGVR